MGDSVSQSQGVAVIGQDLLVLGDVRNCRLLEVHGEVRGAVGVEHLRIAPGGVVLGPVKAGSAEIDGTLEGDVLVTNLIAIGATGRVTGKVRYGRLALAEGGELSADVRNIPPQISGDFQISVRQGRSVRLSRDDIAAVDPDDTAESLTFSVVNPVNGYVALASAPAAAVDQFSQVDLIAGRVLFVHRGADASPARFDVVVTDKAGATSGAPRTVNAAVIPSGAIIPPE